MLQHNDPLTIGFSKQCSKCKLLLPGERFAKDPSSKSGLRSACRTCAKQTRPYKARADSERARYANKKQAFNKIAKHSIYFIAHPHKPEHIKIGYTSNLSVRFKNFLAATSGRILLLALIETNSPENELAYHRQFESLRIGTTEWFLAKAPLLRFLSSLDQFIAHQAISTLTQGQQSRIVVPSIDFYIDKLPFF